MIITLWILSLSIVAPIIHGSERDYWSGLIKDEVKLGYPLLTVRGEKGFLSCAYIDVATCDRTNEACATVSGVMTHEDMLEARVKSVSSKAKQLGIHIGMKGSDAIDLLR